MGRRSARVPRGRALPAAGRRDCHDRCVNDRSGSEHSQSLVAGPAGGRLPGRGGVGLPVAAGAAGGGVDRASAARPRPRSAARRTLAPRLGFTTTRCRLAGAARWGRTGGCGGDPVPGAVRDRPTLLPLSGDSTLSWPVVGSDTHTGAGWHAVWLVAPGVLALVACLIIVWAASRLLVALAPRVLGPS